jgi:ceramide glucosyltransferase
MGMIWLASAAGVFAVAAVCMHVLVGALTVWRCRYARVRASRTPASLPPISIIRPMCGRDACEHITLRSSFRLDYPTYELLLCCAAKDDPVVPLARRLIAEHPNVPARLLIGNERVSENPKLNNMVKGWYAAQHPWIVMADSNVLMPPDYLRAVVSVWRKDTGLVCAPPVGAFPANFAAEFECAFLNTYQASWQYAADSARFGFAQGKTMLWRRDTLDDAGGISALGLESAEDAAATKIVRRAGLRVTLSDSPSVQPLGVRQLAHVWSRQVRWARLRRASFPLLFAPEILTGAALPMLCAAAACDYADLEPAAAAVALAGIWYGTEAMVAWAAGWHLSWRSPLAWAMRDAALPLLWAQAWAGRGFTWRGNDMEAVRVT